MNKPMTVAGLALLCAMGISDAGAASVTYETRAVDQAIDNTDYRASWSNQTSPVTSQSLTDFNGALIPGGVQGGYSHLSIAFSATGGSQWGFQLAPDAGLGGAMYLDGVLLASSTDDLWWDGNWSNTGELLSVVGLTLGTGNHTLEGYWAEACCNGAQGSRYTTDNGATWQSTANLADPNHSAVPVPAAVWLFGSALAGLSAWSRRNQVSARLA